MTDWNKLKVAQLKEELEKRGLATNGKKADLVARLEGAGTDGVDSIDDNDATRKRKASEPTTGDEALDSAEDDDNRVEDSKKKPAGVAKKRPAVTKTRQVLGTKSGSAGDGAGGEVGAGVKGNADASESLKAGEGVRAKGAAGQGNAGGDAVNSGGKTGGDATADGSHRSSTKRARSGPEADNSTDPLVKIENALNTERFANIDPGTKRRIAVILDFTKLPPSTLDDSVLDQLRSLSQAECTEIMKQLDHSVRTSKVRKISAYLSSMIRRAQDDRGGGHDRNAVGTVEDLAPVSRSIMEDLMAQGHLRAGDLDGKVLGTLASKSAPVQAYVLKAFGRKNVSDVRNMAAFFVAHMRDVERGLNAGRYSLDRLPGEGDDHRGRDGRGEPPRKGERVHRNPHPDIYDPHYTYVPTAQRGGGVGGAGGGAAYQPPQFQQQQNRVYDPRAPAPAYDPRDQQQQQQQAFHQPEPKHFALEQVQWGVRVDELNGLSDWAKYVHPAAALRMQQLWDQEENKLVSVLDDNSWLLLAGLDAPNSVRAVNETVERMKLSADDVLTINRLFVEAASKYPRREDAPSMRTAAPAASPLPNLPPQTTTYGNPLFENPNQQRGGLAPPPSYDPYAQLPQHAQHAQQYAPPSYDNAYAQPPGAYNAPQHVPYNNSAPAVHLPGPAGKLSPRLQNRIDVILGNPAWAGRIVIDHFNDHVVNLMLQMDERTNMLVLDEFEREDSSKIRNPKAFLIGKIRQALERRDGGGGHRGDGLPRWGQGGGRR